MSRVVGDLRLLRHAALAGLGDRRALFGWRTWTLVWSSRVLAEVSFYALVGAAVGSSGDVAYLLVGSSVLVAATTTMLAVQSTAWERRAGTLPLLVASPSGLLVPLVGRSLMWIPDALAFSFGGLVVAGLVFGVELPIVGLICTVPLLLACVLGTYGVAAFLGALVIRTDQIRNLVSNVVRSVMAVVTGALVPVVYFPAWVGWLSQVFPATFALRGIRRVLSAGPVGPAMADMARCLAVGAGWLLLAALVVERFAAKGRATGSLGAGGQ